ncbi:MAG: VWA domain-containing protein [Candidatus Aminicenantes bacterium]|nr:VWA domain-containing protein [Candidatus Aminicenantes bacterium]
MPINGKKPRVLGLILLLVSLPFALPASQEAPPSSPFVEVTVRVEKGGQFVASLTLDDFEVREDGRPQRLEALYLFKGQDLLGHEERTPVTVTASRHFYLLFQTTDYDPRLGEAVDDLFRNVLRPGDSMTLMTPLKVYTLTEDALRAKPLNDLSKEMQKILRKDIQSGSGEYREILRDLRRVVQAIGGTGRAIDADMETDSAASAFGLEMSLDRYRQSLMKLEGLRLLDERKLLSFAGSLRARSGRKYVYLFYQREFRPEISPGVLTTLMSLYQDEPNILGDLQDLFQFYRRELPLQMETIKRSFADAGLCLNFIFMNKEAQAIFGATMREQSEDVFQVFTAIARATGGRSETAQNPAASFHAASQATAEHYLLYYTPDNAAKDGTFRAIEVRVKGEGLAVSNRLGYFAR